MDIVQRNEIGLIGIPSRQQLDAMLAAPGKTDVSRHWVRKLFKARDLSDEAEQLPDGSERRIVLLDAVEEIEDQALEFSKG
jgi:hypothetical protein